MAMQIQRGLVKYKDRSDIICTYGVTDNGNQYYFLDDTKLPNGNIIVSTTLLESVDPLAVASHVGVIDSEGNEVIPCNNKTVKSISGDILLVEKANPESPNVLESLREREDPAFATKLVTTPAAIKDNMNKLMGADGRFVFNDQFSEATICDIDGKNLINNEYYSFVSVNDEKIYFSKNIEGSEVVEYPLYPVNEENKEEDAPTLNVETTSVTQDSIEKALSEENQPAPVENTEVNKLDENVYTEAVNIPVEEVPVAPTEPEIPTVSSEEIDKIREAVQKQLEESAEEENVEIPEANVSVEETPVEEAVIPVEKVKEEPKEEIKVDIDIPASENVEEKIEEPVQEEVPEENNDEKVYVEDSYDYDYDNGYNNLLESYDYSSSTSANLPQKSFFDDVTITISNLVELNRNLQGMIDDYDMRLAKCDASRKKLVELSKSQAREISSLNARIARLETDKQVLEQKLAAFSPKSNNDLVRAMADAQNILGQSRFRSNNE